MMTEKPSSQSGAIGTLLASVVLVALSAVAPRLPLWSLDSWSYLSAGQVIAVLVSAGALTLLLLSLPQLLESNWGRPQRWIAYLLVSIALAALLYWLSAATYLYGDGYVRTAEIVEKGKWLRFTEPLDTLLRQLLYRVTLALFDWDGYQAARLISICCGVIYFWVAVWGSKFISSDVRSRTISVALLWATGLVALFFGYVETYPTSAVACLAVLFAALGVLQDKVCGWVMILLFVVASLLHTSMLAFAPALAFVLAHRDGGNWRRAIPVTALVVALLAVVVYLVSVVEHAGGYGVPLLEFVLIPLTPRAGYWLFAVDHVTDMVNEYLLVAPAALLLLPLTLWGAKLKDDSARFLCLASLLGFGFALLFNTHLGFARDWDLFAFIALPLILLVAQRCSTLKLSRYATMISLWLGFAVAGMFVLMLANEDAAAVRFTDITARYERGRGYNYETLSTYYIDKRQYRRAIGALELAEAASRNARYSHLIGALSLELNQPRHATDALKRSLAIDTTFFKNYPLLVEAYSQLREYDSTMAYLKLAVDHLPAGASPADYFQIAQWLQQGDDSTEAASYFRTSQRLCDSLSLANPGDFDLQLLAIRCHTALADTAAARAQLQELLAAQPPAAIRLEAVEILGELDSVQ